MQNWDRFFKWLNPDPDLAASEYKVLRHALISYFKNRGCAGAEDLADATIERVVELLSKFDDQLPPIPVRYSYGVARYIHKEHLRMDARLDHDGVSEDLRDHYDPGLSVDQEVSDHCLYNCLRKLDASKRRMFVRYYLVEPQSKSDFRRLLADQHGITVNALRLQMLRLKDELRDCITACREREAKR